MANTSTIKSLDELVIKAISAIRKSQPPTPTPDETRVTDSIKTFLENCDIDDCIFRKEIENLFFLQLIKHQ